jgi:hypothetical protein
MSAILEISTIGNVLKMYPADSQHPFHLNPFRTTITSAADELLPEVPEDPARTIIEEVSKGICSSAVSFSVPLSSRACANVVMIRLPIPESKT